MNTLQDENLIKHKHKNIQIGDYYKTLEQMLNHQTAQDAVMFEKMFDESLF